MKNVMYKFTTTAFTVLLLSATNISAQDNSSLPVDSKSALITYTKVTELSNTSTGEMYQRALQWANTFYKNPTDVIRERDSVNGSILCKARFKMMNPADKNGVITDAGNVMYSLKIQFKEGRYRYELSEINWKQQSYFAAERWMDKKSSAYKPVYDFYLQQTETEVQRVLQSLEKAMSTKAAAKTDDW